MFKNYFKIAWRSLWKNKFYSAINISGLAVGLATGIMLLLWVQNELSYDKFNKDYKDIYQISTHFKNNGNIIISKLVPGPLAIFANSIPQINSIVRIKTENNQPITIKKENKSFYKNTVGYVDSNFFKVFTFKLLTGDNKKPFPDNNSIVLTQSTAKKIFGSSDVIGQTIVFQKSTFKVSGILQDFPGNSSIKYDALLPMGFYAQQFIVRGGNGDWRTIDEDMRDISFTAFVKLQSGSKQDKVGKDFSNAYRKVDGDNSNISFELQRLEDIHLVGADGNNNALRMVQILMLVVILILAVASINYVNLSTARSLVRAKEVGIRKIIGAKRRQLFFQFITETIMLFFFATLFALTLILLLMPLYNTISGKTLTFSIRDIGVWRVVGSTIIGTLIFSGIYPSILLSSFNPLKAIKENVSLGIGTASFRKILVIFQFTISTILLVCTIAMNNQMNFIKNKDLGYNKSYVFSVPLTQKALAHIDVIKSELKQQPTIVNIGTSDVQNFGEINFSSRDLDWPSNASNEKMVITSISADRGFIPSMQIKLAEGQNFTGTPADSTYYILNETALKKMHLQRPYLGQEISFYNKKGTIIGVVHDFNFQSLKEKITPLIFYTWQNNKDVLYVRTTGQNAQQAIASVEKQYKKYAGDVPFSYSFLDKNFEAQYKSDQRSGTLFNVFAGIAIFISCLGLFGLATYTAEVKRKEIGIRKVLGSSVSGIVQLISKDFLKLVIISIIIAMPIGWWAMNKWLQNFAYRTDISWWMFVVAGTSALLIALLTVSFQAIKAAIANPVDSLRTE